MLDKMSDTSRIVERMLRKGLVEKNICSSDKRLVDVVLTQEGYTVLEKLDKRNEEIDNILEHLSIEEAEMISRLLDKMRDRHTNPVL
jgi:DNA-binding MarR family transcriptional regulator